MDTTALRLEAIKVNVENAQRLAEFHARWRTALLVVTVTLGGTVVVTSLAGQLAVETARPLAAALAVLSGWQLVGLRRLGTEMEEAAQEAKAAIGRLILAEGEPPDDGQEANQG